MSAAIPPLSGHKRASGLISTLVTLRRRLAAPLGAGAPTRTTEVSALARLSMQ
jgi:hypothetical protein